MNTSLKLIYILLFTIIFVHFKPQESQLKFGITHSLAKSKKSKSKKSKKSKSSSRPKPTRKSIQSRINRKKTKTIRRQRGRTTQGTGKTGVQSVWRRDGNTGNARRRYQNTASAIKSRSQRRRQSISRTRRWGRHRPIKSYSSPASSVYIHSDASPPSSQTSNLNHPAEATSPTSKSPEQEIKPKTGWFEGLELETSSTLWIFDAPQLRSESDDWSDAQASPQYRVNSTILFRGDVRVFTRWIDLSAAYESRAGIQFMGDQGSLLDLATSFPRFFTALDPLSFHYQRIRFAEGHVTLEDERVGDLERQRFSMRLDDYELWWDFNLELDTKLTFKIAWRERAMPRHIYLEEHRSDGEDQSYSAYYAISDQLLWTPTQTLDFGLNALVHFEPFIFEMGGGIGGGVYELQTPLEGTLLDEGSLMSLFFSWGFHYEYPFADWVIMRLSYQGQLLSLNPLSLPNRIKHEVEKEIDTSDLSLSFGTYDVLQKLWLSLTFHFE